MPVFVSKNPDFRLPDDKRVPLIMVGPGTGLAPFRAFMLHRLLPHTQPPHGVSFALHPLIVPDWIARH